MAFSKKKRYFFLIFSYFVYCCLFSCLLLAFGLSVEQSQNGLETPEQKCLLPNNEIKHKGNQNDFDTKSNASAETGDASQQTKKENIPNNHNEDEQQVSQSEESEKDTSTAPSTAQQQNKADDAQQPTEANDVQEQTKAEDVHEHNKTDDGGQRFGIKSAEETPRPPASLSNLSQDKKTDASRTEDTAQANITSSTAAATGKKEKPYSSYLRRQRNSNETKENVNNFLRNGKVAKGRIYQQKEEFRNFIKSKMQVIQHWDAEKNCFQRS